MFYDQFNKICKEQKTTPTAVTKKLGYSTSKVTAWKNGSTPKYEVLCSLAEHLNVDVSAFFASRPPAIPSLSNELNELLREAAKLPPEKLAALITAAKAMQ